MVAVAILVGVAVVGGLIAGAIGGHFLTKGTDVYVETGPGSQFAGGGFDWTILIILGVVALVVWFFFFRKKKQ